MDLNHFIVRKPFFNLSTMDRHWALGSPSITHLINALSILTPAFERKVSQSSTLMLKKIKNNDLRKKTIIYLKQEATHTKIHNDYNNRLISLGYRINFLIKLSELSINSIKLFPMFSAACVASGEHFSNFLGRFLISLKDDKNFQHEPFSLFKWHACEEIEHNEICFDISKNVGNKYLIRILAHSYSTLIFFMLFWIFTISLLLQDKEFFRVKTLTDIVGFLFLKKYTNKIFVIEFVKSFFDYFQLNFHPSMYKDAQGYASNYLKSVVTLSKL